MNGRRFSTVEADVLVGDGLVRDAPLIGGGITTEGAPFALGRLRMIEGPNSRRMRRAAQTIARQGLKKKRRLHPRP